VRRGKRETFGRKKEDRLLGNSELTVQINAEGESKKCV
jgi:hypothetical protein